MGIARKVMIVEDELAVMMSVVDTMDDEGFEIVRAYDGKGCIKAIGNGLVPDLILLDLNLPDIHGFEVYKKLRSIDALKNTKIAAFTAAATGDITEKIKELGFDGLFHKPYDAVKLVSSIKELLEGKN